MHSKLFTSLQQVLQIDATCRLKDCSKLATSLYFYMQAERLFQACYKLVFTCRLKDCSKLATSLFVMRLGKLAAYCSVQYTITQQACCKHETYLFCHLDEKTEHYNILYIYIIIHI